MRNNMFLLYLLCVGSVYAMEQQIGKSDVFSTEHYKTFKNICDDVSVVFKNFGYQKLALVTKEKPLEKVEGREALHVAVNKLQKILETMVQDLSEYITTFPTTELQPYIAQLGNLSKELRNDQTVEAKKTVQHKIESQSEPFFLWKIIKIKG